MRFPILNCGFRCERRMVVLLLVVGCFLTFTILSRGFLHRADSIKPGLTTREEVADLLGAPHERVAIERGYEIWYYRPFFLAGFLSCHGSSVCGLESLPYRYGKFAVLVNK